MKEQVVALILASGTGDRVGYHIPKQFIKLAGKTVLEHTVDVFERSPGVDEIYLVVHPLYRPLLEQILLRNSYRKVRKVLDGGATRRESSAVGIDAIEAADARVLIHDAVRPFVTERIIADCLDALDTHAAVDTAIPTADTIIRVDDAMLIQDIPPRQYLMRGQTPQGFRLATIREAHARAAADPAGTFTDDCGIVLRYGLADVHVIKGEERNLKVTYMEDVFLAEKLFQIRAIEAYGPTDVGSLAGRVMVVFGAGRGIGESIAERAEALGATVHGFSRRTGHDVTRFDQIEAALAQVEAAAGRIDYVVNTAGVLRMGKISTRSMDDIGEEIAINYTAAVNVVRASVPYLRKTRGGLLLFTSSSYTRGRALYAVYSSTKAAIVNLVQACAEELHDDGVRINAINPERTATPMRFENFGNEPEGSLLRPERVADVSLQTLVSELTGQVVDVTREPAALRGQGEG